MQQKLLCVNSTPHTVSKLPFSPSTFHFPENSVICVTVFPSRPTVLHSKNITWKPACLN